jgi:hypothetical protein
VAALSVPILVMNWLRRSQSLLRRYHRPHFPRPRAAPQACRTLPFTSAIVFGSRQKADWLSEPRSTPSPLLLSWIRRYHALPTGGVSGSSSWPATMPFIEMYSFRPQARQVPCKSGHAMRSVRRQRPGLLRCLQVLDFNNVKPTLRFVPAPPDASASWRRQHDPTPRRHRSEVGHCARGTSPSRARAACPRSLGR